MELYRTTDNGRTWQRYQFRLPSAEGASTAVLLAFSDARHGWLVQGSATMHTSDGGRTWQNVRAGRMPGPYPQRWSAR